MPKFRFRLSTLLKIREAARDRRRSALAQAYQAEAILRERGEELSDQIVQLRHQYRQAAQPGALQVDRLVERQRYDLVLGAEQNHSQQQLRQLEEEIERRRIALVEADRDVRVLETLREKKKQAHQMKEYRQEVKQLDEVAGQRKQEILR